MSISPQINNNVNNVNNQQISIYKSPLLYYDQCIANTKCVSLAFVWAWRCQVEVHLLYKSQNFPISLFYLRYIIGDLIQLTYLYIKYEGLSLRVSDIQKEADVVP